MSKMSKVLNGLRDYDQIRNEDEEDQQRSMLFEHLSESTDSYYNGRDMLLLLRLQLAFGLEEFLYQVMFARAVQTSLAALVSQPGFAKSIVFTRVNLQTIS